MTYTTLSQTCFTIDFAKSFRINAVLQLVITFLKIGGTRPKNRRNANQMSSFPVPRTLRDTSGTKSGQAIWRQYVLVEGSRRSVKKQTAIRLLPTAY